MKGMNWLHTYYHSSFNVIDLVNSKKKLEELAQTEVVGFRMPRMQPVDEKKRNIFSRLYV